MLTSAVKPSQITSCWLCGVLAGTLVTCGRDNVVRVLDLRTFEPRATLRAPGFAVGAVWTNASLGPDECHAAAGDTLSQNPC